MVLFSLTCGVIRTSWQFMNMRFHDSMLPFLICILTPHAPVCRYKGIVGGFARCHCIHVWPLHMFWNPNVNGLYVYWCHFIYITCYFIRMSFHLYLTNETAQDINDRVLELTNGMAQDINDRVLELTKEMAQDVNEMTYGWNRTLYNVLCHPWMCHVMNVRCLCECAVNELCLCNVVCLCNVLCLHDTISSVCQCAMSLLSM